MQVEMPNGSIWTRLPGGQSTGEQVIRAWEEMCKLNDDAQQWNSWEEDHEARVHEQWWPILTEWENGAPKRLPAEFEAYMAALDAEFDERWAEDERRRASLVARDYDQDRARQRLALLQAEASAAFFRHVLANSATAAQAAAAEQSIIKADAVVAGLRKELGDPDLIIDNKGYLPSERRERHLREHMHCWRHPVLRAWSGKHPKQFHALLRMPRPEPAVMCSECQAPREWHEYALSLRLFRGRPAPGSPAERLAGMMPGWWTECSASTRYRMEHRWGGNLALPDFDAYQWCAMVPSALQEIFGLTCREART